MAQCWASLLSESSLPSPVQETPNTICSILNKNKPGTSKYVILGKIAYMKYEQQ